MARIRSPGYPNVPLREAIELARKIHEKDYTHPVSREVAATHMGFSGITGSSDRAISALLHYGLAGKAGKGEVQLTDTAVDILHPDSQAGRLSALHKAGFAPELFKEIRAKFPDRLPSEETITTHLIRHGFAQRAVGPACRAYVETCRFLQQEGAYESDVPSDPDVLPSSAGDHTAGDERMQSITHEQPSGAPAPQVLEVVPDPVALNDIRFSIEGSTGTVTARFDKQGLAKLIKKLEGLQGILDD